MDLVAVLGGRCHRLLVGSGFQRVGPHQSPFLLRGVLWEKHEGGAVLTVRAHVIIVRIV